MYVGRFAPTTSGPLHLGSLVTAVASFLDARAQHGRWLLRLDDIDVPRNSPSSRSMVLQTLEAHQLHWDGEITQQTDHQDAYEAAIQELQRLDLVFYCTCSRSELRDLTIYPGTCRDRKQKPSAPASLRVKTMPQMFSFQDRVQGIVQCDVSQHFGDFNVQRKEGIPSYPLAVVVDDEVTGVTDVIRGSDLLDNTVSQLYLIDLLQYKLPNYAHLPVLNQRNEIKLSKRDQAVAIDNRYAKLNLTTSMQLLGLQPPPLYDTKQLMVWAIENWDINQVPQTQSFERFISI